MNKKSKNNLTPIFTVIVLVKIVLLGLFSSDFQDKLFIPFIRYFLQTFHNPWEYFYHNPTGPEFPYSAGMLYILTPFYAPVYWLGSSSVILKNLLFKLPSLLADIGIYFILCRIFSNNKRVILYYFASPIIFYAVYIHSQVDLIPTALLFLSVYLLTSDKIVFSALALGLAVSTKFHVIAALPLMLIYLFKKHPLRETVRFIILVPVAYFLLNFPYFSEGFYKLVLNNPQQMFVYDTFINIGRTRIYLPVLAVFVLYARFSAFRKINNDLLYTFLALVFASFLTLTVAAPAWYVWLFPYLSIFFIKTEEKTPDIFRLYVALSAVYLVYIVFFYVPEHPDLTFLATPVDLKIPSDKLRNVSFTLLEVILVASMYVFYKFGIKSNFLYKKNSPTVIGISGDSASGKSTLLSDVKQLLGHKILELEGDADHKWEREDANWQKLTHLNPKANFLHRQYDDIVNLKYGKTVSRSDYDHSTGKFTPSHGLKAGDYIVLSGLHAYYLPKTRKVIDLKIYLDTDDKLRKHWKLLRDAKTRGKTITEVMKQLTQRTDDAQKYIHPQRDFADLVIRYFTEDSYDTGDQNAVPKVKLKVAMDSSVALHELIEHLEQKVNLVWDYSEDLQTQYLVIDGELNKDFIRDLAKKVIVNPEELLGEDPHWLEGYRGFVQLMVLLMLSEKAK